jgi:hypothetical protein
MDRREVVLCTAHIHRPSAHFPTADPEKGRSQATHTRPPSRSPLLTLYKGRF